MTKKAGQDENGVANFRAKLNDYLKSKSEKRNSKIASYFILMSAMTLVSLKKVKILTNLSLFLVPQRRGQTN